MKSLNKILLISLICLFCASTSFSKVDKIPLIIFHAGSLTLPFSKIEKAFEKKYPYIDILRESGGSTKMARMISEVGKPADIMAAADFSVIDSILIPKFASWDIHFASNQMVLCYTDKSKYRKEINSNNWFKILGRKGVIWGHSDPNLDPCGYRSLMVIQLAERYYKVPGLYKKLLNGPSIRIVRPKSVELIALLTTGNMDYAWEYLSVAVQHNLNYLRLPDEINLGNSKFDNFYKEAKVRVTGKRPGQWIIKTGKACTYGITILDNAKHKKEAILFLEFLLDPKFGLKILNEMGQPPIVPPTVEDKKMYQKLPNRLKSIVQIIKK